MAENQQLPMLYERNAEFIRRASVSELTSALLRAAAEDASGDFPMFAEPTVPSQLFILYDAVSLEAKEKMKAALLAVLAEWNGEWHGYGTLRHLVLTAGYIRATGVIEMLRRIISDPQFNTTSARARDALEIVFGVLAGFAPLPAVKTVLERAQKDERYQKYFAAQISNGLCWCDPEHYPKYLRTFLATAATYSKHYMVEEVLAEMVRLIGPDVATRHLHRLSMDEAVLMSRVLNRDLRPTVCDGDITWVDRTGRSYPLPDVGDLPAVWGAVAAKVGSRRGSLAEWSREQAARFGS